MRIDRGLIVKVGAVWLILFLSYFSNIFNVGYGDGWFTDFQNDSAYIVEKTAECKDVVSYREPLIPAQGNDYMKLMGSGVCEGKKVQPYASQYGLQARIVAFFAPADDAKLPNYFKHVEQLLAALTSLVFAIFIVKVWSLYGKFVGITLTTLLAISPWVAAYARNMYWVAFLMFLPFVATFLLYPYATTVKRKVLLFIAVGIVIFLKCLDGYEHITTIGISVFAAIAYWEAHQHSADLKRLWKPLLVTGGVTIGALVLAVGLNIVDLHGYYGSWEKASSAVLSRAEDRATSIKKMQPNVIGNFEVTSQPIYRFIEKFYDIDALKSGDGNPLKYAFFSALNYATLPAVSLPIALAQPLQTILQSIVFVGIVGYLCLRRIGKSAEGLAHMYWIGLVGALSWLVLMPAHAYPHAHLNGIIFYIPFLITCFIIIGIRLQQTTERIQKKIYGKK